MSDTKPVVVRSGRVAIAGDWRRSTVRPPSIANSAPRAPIGGPTRHTPSWMSSALLPAVRSRSCSPARRSTMAPARSRTSSPPTRRAGYRRHSRTPPNHGRKPAGCGTPCAPRVLAHGHLHVKGAIELADGRRVYSLGCNGIPGNLALLNTQTLEWEWLKD